jgi:membrane associated rhomboid family serine protease
MGLDSRDYYRPSGVGGFTFFPPVLKTIIIINLAVYFLQILGTQINVHYDGMIMPLEILIRKFFALIPLPGFLYQGALEMDFYPWQLVTYQFMHSTGDLWHILMNMLILWMFGMEIEHIMGSKKFLIFYLLCGIGAGLAQIIVSPLLGELGAPTIGASGAVYGVMVAFAMFFPDRYIFISFLIPVKAKYVIVCYIIIEFLSVGNASFVAHLAHIGGAVVGFVFVLLDRSHNFNFDKFFSKKKRSNLDGFSFRKPSKSAFSKEVEDADYYDINQKKQDEVIIVTQEEIDRILDKISQSGYQKLTEREKKILFEASRKK